MLTSRQNEWVIKGFEIGHHTADGDGWLTGTTVVLAQGGAIGGVDVRGGGPGTRETDLLHPTTVIDKIDAVVLTGGSAYGLAAANGVMAVLEAAGIGWPVGLAPHEVVPIVPAAVIFDLGRGGVFGNRPTDEFGKLALAAATVQRPETGSVGAGTGAVCGGLKGGFGYAETELESGVSVAAAVVVNAAGSVVDSESGRLWADRRRLLATPSDPEREALATAHAQAQRSAATTIGVVMTDATLTKAQANKVAAVAHDGMARASGQCTRCSTAIPSSASPRHADPWQRIRFASLFAFNSLLAQQRTSSPMPAWTAYWRRVGVVPGRATPSWHLRGRLRYRFRSDSSIPTLVAGLAPEHRGTMKALLLENIHPEGVRLLTERGIEVDTVKGALTRPS
jgi:L-aminopeptidase/D-esterase-like protein